MVKMGDIIYLVRVMLSMMQVTNTSSSTSTSFDSLRDNTHPRPR